MNYHHGLEPAVLEPVEELTVRQAWIPPPRVFISAGSCGTVSSGVGGVLLSKGMLAPQIKKPVQDPDCEAERDDEESDPPALVTSPLDSSIEPESHQHFEADATPESDAFRPPRIEATHLLTRETSYAGRGLSPLECYDRGAESLRGPAVRTTTWDFFNTPQGSARSVNTALPLMYTEEVEGPRGVTRLQSATVHGAVHRPPAAVPLLKTTNNIINKEELPRVEARLELIEAKLDKLTGLVERLLLQHR